MQCINLIPAPRRQAKAKRKRFVVWATGLTLYGMVLVLTYFIHSQSCNVDRRAMAHESRYIAGQIKTNNITVQTLQTQLATARRKLQAVEAVGRQPNMGMLMTVLANSVDDEVVLERFRLAPTKAGQTPDARLVLELEGYSSSQATVSQFAMRLEKTNLFEQINLVKTNRRPFLGTQAVQFQIECPLGAHRGE